MKNKDGKRWVETVNKTLLLNRDIIIMNRRDFSIISKQSHSKSIFNHRYWE